MVKWKTLLPMVLSLVVAATGTYYLYHWTRNQSAPQKVSVSEVNTVPIAVASLDLPWGTKITPEMVKLAPFLEKSLPDGYANSVASVVDRVLIASMKQGEPICAHRLAPADIQTGGVPAVLKPGKRAVAVKGDKVIGISGFVNPGNRVDVLVTMREPKQKIDRTKIILQDILVLATGTQVQKNNKGEPAPVDIYTLEVTPQEAEKLALAAAQGKLQFALRNVIDTQAVATAGTSISETLAGQIAKSAPVKRKWRPRPVSIVEAIRGTEVKKEKHNP